MLYGVHHVPPARLALADTGINQDREITLITLTSLWAILCGTGTDGISFMNFREVRPDGYSNSTKKRYAQERQHQRWLRRSAGL